MTGRSDREWEHDVLDAALDEDMASLIVLVYDCPEEKRLDALIEAVQFIDKEACDYADHILEQTTRPKR